MFIIQNVKLKESIIIFVAIMQNVKDVKSDFVMYNLYKSIVFQLCFSKDLV